jgi:hypothetical protein
MQQKRKDNRNMITTHPLRSSAVQRAQDSPPVMALDGGIVNPLAFYESYLDAAGGCAELPTEEDAWSTTEMDVSLVATDDRRAQP